MRLSLDLKHLLPNPFRDFKLDPVDDDHVDELAKSIAHNDFWGGIVARRVKIDGRSGYQLAAGEHRRRAALKSKIYEADIFVGNFTDEQMLTIYATENATQRGNTATALLGSIGSALRACLREVSESLHLKSEDRRGSREGIGWRQILDKLPDIPGVTTYTVQQQLATLKSSGQYDRIVSEVNHEAALAKAAELAAIRAAEEEAELQALRAKEAAERRRRAEEESRKAELERRKRAAEVERTRKAAREAQEKEERRRAAERAAEAQRQAKEAEARRKIVEREAEAARKEDLRRAEAARKAAAKAREETARKATVEADQKKLAEQRIKAAEDEKKRPIEFDMRVSNIFKNPLHVETFRKLVTHPKVARILLVEQQVPVARAIIERQKQMQADAAANRGNRTGRMGEVELSSLFIDTHFFEIAAAPLYLQHLDDKQAKREAQAELAKLGWETRWANQESYLKERVHAVSKTIAEMVKLKREAPDKIEYSTKVNSALIDLKNAVESLESLGAHKHMTVDA